MGTLWESHHHPRPLMVVCFVFAAAGPTPGSLGALLLVWVCVGSRQGTAPGRQLAGPLVCEPSTHFP